MIAAPTGKPPRQAATLASLAIAAFLFAAAYRAAPLTFLGSLLLLTTLAHLLTFGAGRFTPAEPLLLATLLHASATLAVARVLSRRESASTGIMVSLRLAVLSRPLQLGSLIASLLAVPLLATCLDGHLGHLALYASWLSLLWVLLALLNTSPILFAAGQAALFLAAGAGVAAARQASALALTEPVALQDIGLALAGVALAWTILRQIPRIVSFIGPLYPRFLPSLDRCVLGLLVAGQLAVAIWGITPGLAEELSPSPPADAARHIPIVPEVYAAAGPLTATTWPAVAVIVTLTAALMFLAWPSLRRRDGCRPSVDKSERRSRHFTSPAPGLGPGGPADASDFHCRPDGRPLRRRSRHRDRSTLEFSPLLYPLFAPRVVAR